MGDTVKHRAAVVAEGRRQEREHLPFVLLARLGTRNRGPGKPGPSLWSDPVAKIERERETAVRRSIDTPWESGARNKSIKLATSLSPHFFFLFFSLTLHTACFYYRSCSIFFIFFRFSREPQKLEVRLEMRQKRRRVVRVRARGPRDERKGQDGAHVHDDHVVGERKKEIDR